jgi:hypothetical protein
MGGVSVFRGGRGGDALSVDRHQIGTIRGVMFWVIVLGFG